MDIVREETEEHMETKPGQRNTGQQDELATSGSCCIRQMRMATFGLWPVLHWERRGLSQVKSSSDMIRHVQLWLTMLWMGNLVQLVQNLHRQQHAAVRTCRRGSASEKNMT